MANWSKCGDTEAEVRAFIQEHGIAEDNANLVHGLKAFAAKPNFEIFNLFLSEYKVNLTGVSLVLFSACQGGDRRIVDSVLNMGFVDYNFGLEGACQSRHVETAFYMLRLGATGLLEDPSLGDAGCFDRAFTHAVRLGSVDLLQIMYERGANTNRVKLWAQHALRDNYFERENLEEMNAFILSKEWKMY